MFESIMKFFKKIVKKEESKECSSSKDAAKERLHLVLMQDRANVSADFLELMKQEIIEVIKKYIEVDEGAIDVRLTNKENEDGTNGAPALYANIPILNIKNEARKIDAKDTKKESKSDEENKNQNKENVSKDSKSSGKNKSVVNDDNKIEDKQINKENNATDNKEVNESKVENKEEKIIDEKVNNTNKNQKKDKNVNKEDKNNVQKVSKHNKENEETNGD